MSHKIHKFLDHSVVRGRISYRCRTCGCVINIGDFLFRYRVREEGTRSGMRAHCMKCYMKHLKSGYYSKKGIQSTCPLCNVRSLAYRSQVYGLLCSEHEELKLCNICEDMFALKALNDLKAFLPKGPLYQKVAGEGRRVIISYPDGNTSVWDRADLEQTLETIEGPTPRMQKLIDSLKKQLGMVENVQE